MLHLCFIYVSFMPLKLKQICPFCRASPRWGLITSFRNLHEQVVFLHLCDIYVTFIMHLCCSYAIFMLHLYPWSWNKWGLISSFRNLHEKAVILQSMLRGKGRSSKMAGNSIFLIFTARRGEGHHLISCCFQTFYRDKSCCWTIFNFLSMSCHNVKRRFNIQTNNKLVCLKLINASRIWRNPEMMTTSAFSRFALRQRCSNGPVWMIDWSNREI